MALFGCQPACDPVLEPEGGQSQSPRRRRATRVCFVGNSFVYYNDLPRILEAIAAPLSDLNEGGVLTGHCLRGGASLPGLWRRGGRSELSESFFDFGPKTVHDLLFDSKEHWDFCVLNDYSQVPFTAFFCSRCIFDTRRAA